MKQWCDLQARHAWSDLLSKEWQPPEQGDQSEGQSDEEAQEGTPKEMGVEGQQPVEHTHRHVYVG